mgnify:CR=1 FL=1
MKIYTNDECQLYKTAAAAAAEMRFAMNLKGRDFLKLLDYTPEEITYLLDLAADLKDKKKEGILVDTFRGKNIALIFEKTSTRTRCSFEVAAHDLGISVTYLDPSGSQIGKKESIADTARVLSRMYDGIEYRGYGQAIVEELAKYSSVPVWNGLTNEFHPTQMLADLLTIREHFGHLKGIHFTYMGDARYNMGNSLMIACSKMGLHFTACTNKKYFPDESLVEQCKAFAKESGIPELTRTTRDEPDYDKLMNWRLGILKEHGLGLKEIQETIAKIDPLPGAKEFLDKLRETTQVIIISDTFTQFAAPLMKKLGWPTIFCNTLEVAKDGTITGFKMRCEQSKLSTVKALQSVGFETIASGDSHNDLGMIQASKAGFLFRTTDQIKADYPQLEAFEEYDDLFEAIKKAL